MAFWHKISRVKDGVSIPGTLTHAFIHNGSYFLAEIKVYQDGMIDCWELVDFEGFKKKIEIGWVVTTLPSNVEVSISRMVTLTATDVKTWIKEAEFVKEVADEIEKLNGRPTSIDRCLKALRQFQDEQSEDVRQQFVASYEAVPEHVRWFMMDDFGYDPTIDVKAAMSALKKNDE